MSFKLDDFLTKKKEPTQVLDLSRVRITSKEEFRKYFEKVPEFRIKPEKVVPESVKIRDKDFAFAPGKREEKHVREWSFPDPTPPDMKAVKLEDLCPVNIDWKMLTTLRPKTKVEEEMFSRLVQLGKLDLKYQQQLLREKSTDWVRKTKNPRSSIVEVRVLSCKECGEDFCDGSLCSKLTYENFSRTQPSHSDAISSLKEPETGKSLKKSKKKRKRKSRRRMRSTTRRVKPRKNSIFNRAPVRGCSRDHSRRGSHARAEKMRSSSLNRLQEPKPKFFHPKRSKSAPRLRREKSEPKYTSDSGPTHTDYSSQSDSESNPDEAPNFGNRKHGSARVGFADSYEDVRSPNPRRERSISAHFSGSDGIDSRGSNESIDSSSSPEKSSRTDSRHPTTIQITFDGSRPASTVFVPRKSYPSGRKSERQSAAYRNQEITKIVDGFTRIDLSFIEDLQCEDQRMCSRLKRAMNTEISPKRVSPRVSRPRYKYDREPFPSPSYVKGQGLLAKFVNRKK